MQKSFLKFTGVALIALAVATFGKADPIVGQLDISQFGSYATIDFGAETVSFHPSVGNAIVGHATGDYASLFGASVSYLDFSYALSATPETVWMINSSTYFVLTSFTYVAQSTNPASLSLWGTGTVYLAGHDATQGLWTFSSSAPQGSQEFSFSSSNTPDRAVPDGGTTALLVGLGFLGMGFVARRRR